MPAAWPGDRKQASESRSTKGSRDGQWFSVRQGETSTGPVEPNRPPARTK